MSDRHLYKAKRTDNGEWIIGNRLDDGVTGKVYIHAAGNSVNESDKVGEEGRLQFVAFEVNPSTICQYTGLKDKNGKLIWENDIIVRKIYGNKVISTIAWTDIGFTGFMLKTASDNGCSYYPMGRGMHDDDESERCSDKVVGNIFDNPELLEGGA